MRTIYRLIAPALLMATGHPACADTLISNLPPTNDGANSVIATTSGGQSKAAGFTLPAGLSYRLDSITMRLDVTNTASMLTINLYGGTGNPSGPVLTSFVVPSFSSTGVASYTFLPSSPFTLTAGSTYWIAATGTSPSSIGVLWEASNPNVVPTGIATSAGYRVNNSGAYPPTTTSSVFNSYSVQGTAAPTPEPAVWSLMIVGFGMVGAATRRRRRAARSGARAGRVFRVRSLLKPRLA